jgi:asparagine synthase (glutamine-hydrolysing)
MYRYVAFVWNPQDATAVSCAERLRRTLQRSPRPWSELFAVSGSSIFTLTPRYPGIKTYKLPNNAGVILGQLFPTNQELWSPIWEPVFGTTQSKPTCDDFGESILRRFWGGYIGLFRNSTGTRCRVVRDCSGKIPCYRAEQDSVHVFFSDLSTLYVEGLQRFAIDWSCLAAFIYSRDAQIRRSPLFGVTELLAGDAVEVSDNAVRQYVAWDPREIVRGRWVDDYVEAKRLLRLATQYSVDAWASVYSNITLRLSGGLDSAVVLGSLKRSPRRPAVLCTHQFSDHPHDDERAYARLAADAAGLPMIELPRAPDGEEFSSILVQGQELPRPSIQALFGSADFEALTQIAVKSKAETTWTGQGGDHLFFQAHSSLGAADYVSRRGIDAGFIKAVFDSANISREPYFFVLRSAWQLGHSRGPWISADMRNCNDRKAPFLNPDALPPDLESYMAHPWTTQAADIPKGKQFQIGILADVLNRHRPTPSVEPVDEHHPLLSQPLIELCLQIPTYHLLRGGRQRALARDAFDDRVPHEILLREDKGVTTTYVTDTIRRNQTFICDLLLDGILVRHRLINRDELDPYIVQGQSIGMEHFWPLLSCIAAELWVRRWLT